MKAEMASESSIWSVLAARGNFSNGSTEHIVRKRSRDECTVDHKRGCSGNSRTRPLFDSSFYQRAVLSRIEARIEGCLVKIEFPRSRFKVGKIQTTLVCKEEIVVLPELALFLRASRRLVGKPCA